MFVIYTTRKSNEFSALNLVIPNINNFKINPYGLKMKMKNKRLKNLPWSKRKNVSKIKEIRKFTYSDSFGEEIQELISCQLFYINSVGDLIGEFEYGSNLQLKKRIMFEYDQYKNLIKKITFDPRNLMQNRRIYYYDSNSSLISESQFGSNEELRRKTILKYDANMNIIDKSKYHSDGSLIQELVFTYDDQKNLIGKECIYPSGLRWNEILKYDQQNRLIQKSRLGNEKKTTVEYKYEYDSNSNLIFESSTGTGNGYKTIQKYNVKNQLTEKRKIRDNETLVSKQSLIYDDNSNLIEESFYKEENVLDRRLIYSYNPEGELEKSNEYVVFTTYRISGEKLVTSMTIDELKK